MKDLETIFRERRIACDGVVSCPVDDWSAIVSQVSDMEAINLEMYEMLESCHKMLISVHHNTGSLGAKTKAEKIDELLSKARGEQQ